MTNKWREIRLSAEAILPAGPDNLPITHANELGEMIEPVTLAACMLLWLHFRPSAHCRFLKKLTRIIRDFHWHGRKDAKSGSCLVSWQRICRPLEYDLHLTGISLRARWLWLQATDPSRPWHHLQEPCDAETRQLFRASTTWTLGDGRTCRFWCEHWLGGQSVSEFAPSLLSLVPCHRHRRTLVCDRLALYACIRDVHGT